MIRRAGPIATGLLLAAGSFVAMAVLLLVAELSVRVLLPEACGRVRGEAERIAAARRYLAPCFTPEQRDGRDYLVAPAVPGVDQPAAFPRQRSAGVARIAVVGESSADLLAKHLAKLGRAPGCAFELLNCAQPGSGLEHVERRLDEILRYEPDAVVLLFGHNISFRFDLDEDRLRLQGLRARSCLLSQLAPEAPPAGDSPLDARLAAFEKFLRRAAGKARADGVALAVATMPANLWLPPGAGLRDEDEARFLAARFQEARGRRAESIGLLEALVAERDTALWHYQLGLQLARLGGDERRAHYELHLALDEDTLRMRAPSRVNEILRAVAGEEKLLLRDTARAVESRAPGAMPGWESFIDNCHLLPAVVDREAAAVVSLLGGTAPLPAACAAQPTEFFRKGLADVLAGVFSLTASGPAEVAELWYDGLSLAVESWISRDRAAADRDVSAFLDGPSFAAAAGEERSSRVLVATAEGYERAGWHERALALNERARASGGAEPWVQKGLFHVRRGEDDAARQAFERALAIDGTRADARVFLRLVSEAMDPGA